MPSLQVVNTTRDKPEPTGVEQFFSKLGKDYKDKQDQVEIGKLINEYQTNRQDANAWEDLQLGLQKSTIGPTKRLEAQKELNDIQKTVLEKDKVLNAQAKSLADTAEKTKKEKEALDKQAKLDNEAKIKTDKTANEVKEILLNGGEDEAEAERLSRLLTPTSATARVRKTDADKKVVNKKTEKEEEEEKSKAVTQKAFDEIAQLVPKAGVGTEALSIFGGENAKTAGKFTSLTGALEALLVEKVNRGALSNTRFQYITKTLLPKVTDTQAEIKGKLEGLAVILELDPSELENLDKKKSKSKEQKAPEGKVRVMLKGSNPPQYGSVTPYPGMESKYDVVSK